MLDLQNFVDGKFRLSTSAERIEVRNPATGQLICTMPESTDEDVDGLWPRRRPRSPTGRDCLLSSVLARSTTWPR
jgi:hypothetical protein